MGFRTVSPSFLFAVGLGYRLLFHERVKAEADKMKELDQMKSRFFANISHEFRTPLSLILGPLQKSEERIPLSEMDEENIDIPVSSKHIKMMKRNAKRLQQLVNQILDLSKLESGKMDLNLEEGGVIAFVRSRVSEFIDIAHINQIHLTTTYSEDNLKAVFDRDKLEKIIANLLSNAIKFTPANQKIHAEAKVDDRYLYFRVADTGPGMTENEVAQIFDRFYQSNSADRQGSGIGLALVKDLVELLNGHIHVESLMGNGTNITCKLSIHSGDYPTGAFGVPKIHSEIIPNVLADLSHPKKSPHEYENNTESKPLLLLVEDNLDLQSYVKELLETQYQIQVASDGEEGIKMAQLYTPDLVISDIMMPKVDGYQLCTSLQKDEKTSHIPIILLTAKSDDKNKIEGLGYGAVDYLYKPFDANELQIKVKNQLKLREAWRAKFEQNGWLIKKGVHHSMDEQFLQKVVKHIQENLSNEYYSVESLAEEIGYSRSQLFRKLKALTGLSPLKMIRLQRLNHAKELLEAKAMTVSEVAYQVGYSNLSYFSQSFKSEFGIQPSEIGNR